jgi:hypothetical protein
LESLQSINATGVDCMYCGVLKQSFVFASSPAEWHGPVQSRARAFSKSAIGEVQDERMAKGFQGFSAIRQRSI